MTIDDLALIFVRGLGARGAAHLMEHYGSAEAVYDASRSDLVEGAGLREDIAEGIIHREGLNQALKEVEYCRKHGISMIAATDPEYPLLLKHIPDRPHVLFVKGNIDVLRKPTLSMVGTREMTPSGQYAANKLIEGLAAEMDEFTLVSGIAYGVDAACHRAALAHSVPSVAVLANALPEINPAPHRQLAEDILRNGGALVSELSSQSRQNGKLFIARNRIIAGLSMGVVVVESSASGGSIATANIADSYNRVVMAVPGRISDSASFGTNNLIRSGVARLVLTARDIILDMDWESHCRSLTKGLDQDPLFTDLAPEELTVMAVFDMEAKPDMSKLLSATRLTIGELMMVLMNLEIKGLIRTLPGQRYEKI